MAVLGLFEAAPAFAHDGMHHNGKVIHDSATRTESSTFVEKTTYRTVAVPLTPAQVEQRRNMITKIEQEFKKVDLDNDHQISYDEYAFGDRRLHTDGQDVKVSFKSIDTNNDGKLSSQEILEGQVAQMERGATPVATTYTRNEVVHYVK